MTATRAPARGRAGALPGEIRRFLTHAKTGELEVSFRNLDDAVHVVYALGHQMIYAAVGIAAAAMALVLEDRQAIENARIAWWVSGCAAVLLVGSMWLTRGKLKRQHKR